MSGAISKKARATDASCTMGQRAPRRIRRHGLAVVIRALFLPKGLGLFSRILEHKINRFDKFLP